jgi:RNA polymerase sigma factor (sigma-70 family)
MEIDHVKRAKEGDRASFAFLVEKYKDLAFSVAIRVCHNSQDAEDIVQEAFIRVYRNLSKFRNESKFSTWLYRIVYNESVLYLRKYGKESIPEEKSTRLIEISTAASDLVEKQELRERVNAILDSMTDNYGAILTLYYINEKDINEIHEITGLSVSNIKVILLRAREKFRERMLAMMGEEAEVFRKS